MPLERSEVQHIAALARIGLTDADIDMFQEQLSQILELSTALGQVDTSRVQSSTHAIQSQTVLREDKAGDSLSPEEVLRNAPRRDGDLFKVKAVLEE